jgi:hypothetical protein
VEDQTIELASGRTVGLADYGIPGATAVLSCHGGPGSRLEPACLRREASEAGLRIISIDTAVVDRDLICIAAGHGRLT